MTNQPKVSVTPIKNGYVIRVGNKASENMVVTKRELEKIILYGQAVLQGSNVNYEENYAGVDGVNNIMPLENQPQKCPLCQFEPDELGENHSFECPRYKSQQSGWEELDSPHKNDCDVEPPPQLCKCQREAIRQVEQEAYEKGFEDNTLPAGVLQAAKQEERERVVEIINSLHAHTHNREWEKNENWFIKREEAIQKIKES